MKGKVWVEVGTALQGQTMGILKTITRASVGTASAQIGAVVIHFVGVAKHASGQFSPIMPG
jgi:hypothetical protein